MFELRPFTEQPYSSGAQYNAEFSGRPVSSVGLVADFESSGTYTTDIDDQPYTLLGSPEIVQAEQTLIRMEGQDWGHLSAFLSGGYPERVSLASSGVDGVCTATIDLERLMPGAAINASAAKVFLRGTWAPPTAAGAGGAITSGTLRGFVGGSALDLSQGFRRPKISSLRMDISADSSDISQKVDFDQDTLVVGLLCRQHDASVAAARRADGIVKKLRVDVNLGRGGSRELIRQTWRQARHYTISKAGYGADDIAASTGVVVIPLRDPRNQNAGKAFFFRKGDSLTIHVDTASAAELGYVDITPAASDALVVTILGFTLVGGAGLGADAELRTVGGTRPSRRARVRRSRN